MKTRFAPSPTGRMHTGNLRTAIITWLHARKSDGIFTLRIDDTDFSRSLKENAELIKHDLITFGLQWDEMFHQSDRFNRYDEIFDDLVKKGYIYPCYETKEELKIAQSFAEKQGRSHIYDRSKALNLSTSNRVKLESEGRMPHYRFSLANAGIVRWTDMIKGSQVFDSSKLNDPIVKRTDGSYTYMLPSVIDDSDYNITDIIRGEDHLTNTATQIPMFLSMNKTPPKMAHISLLKNSEQGKMSKRTGAMSLGEFLESGIEKMSMVAYLAALGTAKAPKFTNTINELIYDFDLSNYGSASPIFDHEEVKRINKNFVKIIPFQEIQIRSAQIGKNISEQEWNVLKNNLDRFDDLFEWQNIFQGDISFPKHANSIREICLAFAQSLETADWNETSLQSSVKNVTLLLSQYSKTEIFSAIRVALTGRHDGPNISQSLLILGKEKTLKRLKNI